MYQKHMGHVDRMDKNVALSRLRLKRCIKRYHRALFVWYMAVVLNNMMVLFDLLFSDTEELKKSKARFIYSLIMFMLVSVAFAKPHGAAYAHIHTCTTHSLACTHEPQHRIGYKHWFQNSLGNALIQEGVRVSVACATVQLIPTPLTLIFNTFTLIFLPSLGTESGGGGRRR